MRRFDRVAFVVVALLSGCSVRLDHLPSKSSNAADAGVPAVDGCRLFHPAHGSTPSVSGRASSVVMPDGRALWIVDTLDGASGSVSAAGTWVAAGASVADCFAGATWIGGATPASLIAPSPLGADLMTSALAAVRANGSAYLYYALNRPAPGEPFGTHLMGYGVARWDTTSERFVPTSDLLWTGDRPDYGAAIVVDGATAYAYGCKSSGFLADDCFVARAPAAELNDAGAYEYSTGGGHWSSDPDDAWPVISNAGDPIGILHDAATHRYVAAYVTPLGDTLTVRSGLGPDGPWSGPFDLARCTLPRDQQAFCGGVALHPELANRIVPGSIALSYAISTFTPGAADAAPEAYWSRLAVLKLPDALP
jgi:hypothetical protein